MNRDMLNVYFVMGTENCNGKDPSFVLQEAIRGGITLFQFREKGDTALQGQEKVSLAIKLRDICHQHKVPFIVNDDINLALEVNADGVHIGQEDDDFISVKRRLPAKSIIGVSCHTLEEAAKAIADGADYLGVGPMFFTTTKKDIHAVQGPKVIREIRDKGYTIPIVGIGGINNSNARKVLEHGADGIAVISAISMATYPSNAAFELKEIHKTVKNNSPI
ncbi:thiamine phosphate synthase [Sutcliffiella rhizosphaerae]|uniref:Thiamine-phosphate synthase n=1 Tax=Sutcliffiella rhizosphaerae TaxID=2880967 RepID=A0ABN8AGH2_9BACI|nr:thiamine phosphate synthase [Sutcliffiella rhizosphaerae]CAG9622582.1 Thiamine-phosphate synthase [Sutcliffiella rhizosphaerae]